MGVEKGTVQRDGVTHHVKIIVPAIIKARHNDLLELELFVFLARVGIVAPRVLTTGKPRRPAMSKMTR
jgi:hypothetical protein